MRNITYSFFLVLASFAIFCNNSDSKQQSASRENAKLLQEALADTIRSLLIDIKRGREINDEFAEKILKHYREAEDVKKGVVSMKEGDNELFYDAIKSLEQKARNDSSSLKILIKLSTIVKRNVEYSEFLMKLTPKLAILNPNDFVRLYAKLNNSEKGAIIENLDYFKGPDEYKLFLSKLDSLRDKSTQQTVNEIKKKLEESLMQ